MHQSQAARGDLGRHRGVPKWQWQAACCEPENAVPSLLPSLPTPFSSAVNSPFPFQNSSGASGLCFSSTCSYLPPALPHRAVQRRRFGGSLSAARRCPQASPVVSPAGTGPTSSTPGAPIAPPCAYPVGSFMYLKQKTFIIFFFSFQSLLWRLRATQGVVLEGLWEG